MARSKGSEKFGGRKKGTPNKKTIELKEFFDSVDFCIPEEISKTLPSLEPEKKVEVLLKLMEFIYPKRKALEVNQTVRNEGSQSRQIDLKKLNEKELLFLQKITKKSIKKD